MLAFPLAGEATPHQQRRPHSEVAPRPAVCPKQQRQPFREGEPADEHQHRLFRVTEDRQVSVAVAHRPHHPDSSHTRGWSTSQERSNR